VMRVCNAAQRPDKALELFDRMQEDGVSPDVCAYGDALFSCDCSGKPAKAVALFQEMKQRGLRPDAPSLGPLIDAHCRVGDFDRGWQMYEEVIKMGIPLETKFFRKMVENMDLPRLKAHGLKIFDEMLSRGLFPTMPVQNRVIVSWRSALPPFVLARFEEMKANGCLLSPTAYRCLMHEHQKSNPQRTLELYEEALQIGFKLDRVSCNAVLNACTRTDRFKEALQMFEAMEKQGLEPNDKTYGALAKACFLSEENQHALDLFAKMRRDRVEPNRFHYHDFVRCAAKLDKIDDMVEMYREMVSKKIAPCNSTFTILIKETLKHGMNEIAAEIMEHNTRVRSMPEAKRGAKNKEDQPDEDEDGFAGAAAAISAGPGHW